MNHISWAADPTSIAFLNSMVIRKWEGEHAHAPIFSVQATQNYCSKLRLLEISTTGVFRRAA